MKVKHIVDENHLTRNVGYKSLEEQINEFIESLPNDEVVVDIKYSSVFDVGISNVYGRLGIPQFSALILYKNI